MRKGPWKLLVQNNQSKLYNLDEDLAEKNNLAKARPAMVKQLEDELSAWEQEVSAGVKLRA
jgi:cob(I)alamin adenosyltransferase